MCCRYLSRTFVTALTSSVFILPLCFFKRLDVLSYASSVGCVTIIYVIWLIIYKSFTVSSDAVPPMKIWPDNAYEILQIVPIICFAYQVHTTLYPLFSISNHLDYLKIDNINIAIITWM